MRNILNIFLENSIDSVSEFLKNVEIIKEKLKNIVDIDISETNIYNTVSLDHIASNDTGKGHGSKALSEICDLADNLSITIILEVANETDVYDDDDIISEDELIYWYEKHGFELMFSLTDRSMMTRRPIQQ